MSEIRILKVFMIMPFEEEFFKVYEELNGKLGDKYEFSNAEAENNQQNILSDIIPPLFNADVVIADLTGTNPNVMYELGLAHCFKKKTIMITQDALSDLPFDLKQYRAKNYSTHFVKISELIDYVKTNLEGVEAGTVLFSNPVLDYYGVNEIEDFLIPQSEEIIEIESIDEKGFLDFISELEEDGDNLTNCIESIIQNLNSMTSTIDHSAQEIGRVNKTGGSGTVSFVRKETKKVAKSIEEFSSILSEGSKKIYSLWDRIEANSFGLIENPYTHSEGNKENLIAYLRSINNMKEGIIGSRESIIGFKQASLANIGVERSLNQAIRFLDNDLQEFLDNMDRISISVDKIINKGRTVLDDGEYDQVFITVVDEGDA